ncbi:MAG: phosphonate metabolism transcriptional regulator PhnF [Hyphomicrobiaceae bacterium]
MPQPPSAKRSSKSAGTSDWLPHKPVTDVNGRPRWKRAADAIEAEITHGRLSVGTRLPSETILAKGFGINRQTVRRAVAELTKKGLLRTAPHTGAVVAPIRISIPLGATDRVSTALEDAGFTVAGRLLASHTETAPADVAAELNRPALTSVVKLDHLHLVNGLPIAVTTTYAPADRFARLPEFYQATGTIPKAFSQLGLGDYKRSKVILSSRPADATECQLLDLPANAIITVLHSVYVDADGEPIRYSVFRFSANRVEFVLTS